jgi:hypothetical protein
MPSSSVEIYYIYSGIELSKWMLKVFPGNQSFDAVRVIQYMLAPAVMINACGLLLLSANNKYSNVVNRIRLINDEKRRLIHRAAEKDFTPEENLRLESATRQLYDLSIRARLVRNSVLSYTIAAAMFVLCSLSIGAGMFQAFVWWERISTLVFLAGMIAVFVGVMFGVLESKKGYEIVQFEIEAEQ